MGTRYNFFLRNTLLFVDLLIVNSGFLIGHFYKYENGLIDNTLNFWLHLFLFNLLWLGSAYVLHLYPRKNITSPEIIYRATAKTTLLHATCVTLISFYLYRGAYEIKLKGLFLCYGYMVLCFILSRFLLTYMVEFIIKQAGAKRKTAVVGYNNTARELASWFRDKRSLYSFEGFFDNPNNSGYTVDSGGKIISPIEQCIDYAVKNDIQEIFSTLMPEDNYTVKALLKKAEDNCVKIRFVPAKMPESTGNYHFFQIDHFPVIGTHAEPLANFTARIKKRIFDIIFSSLVIVFVLSWLIPLIGLLIKLESRGPVFFIQKRSGRYNKVFGCLKFRSMRVSEDSDLRQATKGDNRITRIGKFLRSTSLDEFPQFLNVFRGEMSIIGPRPHMLAHTEQYRKIIDRYMVRQFIKPGITGWAQVNGYRGETTDAVLMERRVEHDIWYMENWCTMLDIKIAFMTVINIFKGQEQAY